MLQDVVVAVAVLVLVAVETVAQGTAVVNAMEHAVALVDLAALEVVLEVIYSQSINEREQPALERWYGEEHNVHRHEGMSIGL